jgi:predicted acetyltransferase
MSLEIRPIKETELEEFMRVASTALIRDPHEFEAMRPEFTLCGFEAGKMAASYAAWPLTMRFNGKGVPVAGVTCVGTLPIHRRRGILRKITTRHFEQLHEEGDRPIAILNASWAAIYQRYGYAVVSTRNLYDVEPRFLEFSTQQPDCGLLRELEDGQGYFSLLVDLYRKFRSERTGYVHRGRAMWNAGVLAPPPINGGLHKVVYEENGVPLGYAIYTVLMRTPPMTGHRLTVRDLVWLSPSAYRAFWNHFALMDLIENIIWERIPTDDPLPHLLLEPRMLNLVSKDGLLARIVDIESALTGREYAGEANLTFEVLDDVCPWNRGRWRLETSGAQSRVGKTGESPQLTIPIGTLAMLVFGQIRPSEAARMGRLEVCDENALPVWDDVMRTKYRPHCADFF